MWIKKTKVKTKKETITYIQLMKTEYIQGRSRQKLILNLGRAEEVDLEKAEILAKSISDDQNYDFVDDEIITLLPVKLYGEVHILMKLFEITSMYRFCQDSASSKGLSEDSVQGIFTLLCYYFLNVETQNSLHNWAQNYFLPTDAGLKVPTLIEAFTILNAYERIHPGIETLRRNASHSGEPLFLFCCSAQKELRNEEEAVLSCITVNAENLPLIYTSEEQSKFKVPESGKKAPIVFSDDYQIIQSLKDPEQNYVYLAGKNRYNQAFRNPRAVQNFIHEQGTFKAFKEFGYREKIFEGLRVILIAPSPGERPSLDDSKNEPRDIIISNSTLEIEQLLDKCFFFQQVQDICAEIYLPKDLDFLYEHFSVKELGRGLIHLQAVQIFLIAYLQNKLRNVYTFQEVFQTLRPIKIARIQLENTVKLVHSCQNPKQLALLNEIAFH